MPYFHSMEVRRFGTNTSTSSMQIFPGSPLKLILLRVSCRPCLPWLKERFLDHGRLSRLLASSVRPSPVADASQE
ncbi:hypothetical protein Mapa_002949 [Marchantia paleacea]|nr:hypothetical protein Mapa_002949 [Marchantia paleacea]